MPYIKQEDRENFNTLVTAMNLTDFKTAGELNYLITRLVHAFLDNSAESYQNYNNALGALEGAKLELYRQFISKYEDLKIEENGNVP